MTMMNEMMAVKLIDEELDGIQKRYAHIDPNNIHLMKATINNDGNPCLMVFHGNGKRHEFPLMEGWEIYIANEFLRSLNTGYYISFENIVDYAKLVRMCMKRLQKRRKLV